MRNMRSDRSPAVRAGAVRGLEVVLGTALEWECGAVESLFFRQRLVAQAIPHFLAVYKGDSG